MRANGGGVEMNRFVQLIHWPVAGPSVCGILLLVVWVATCSQPSEVTVQQPLTVAAQPAPQATGGVGVFAQPFVAIANQAKASVVHISSVRKNEHRSEQGASPFFRRPVFQPLLWWGVRT